MAKSSKKVTRSRFNGSVNLLSLLATMEPLMHHREAHLPLCPSQRVSCAEGVEFSCHALVFGLCTTQAQQCCWPCL